MATKEICYEGVFVKFGEKEVLKNLNLRISPGEVVGIMGASGIGKTTFLKTLLGLLKPTKGSIKGLENQRFSAVFQEDRLCECFDAITNVKMVLPPFITEGQIEEEFKKVALTDFKNKPVSQLSGGMKRRVAIVRAVMAKSEVLILDEPFKGLDEELKQQVICYMKEAIVGKTVILVTHDKAEIEAFQARLLKFA